MVRQDKANEYNIIQNKTIRVTTVIRHDKAIQHNIRHDQQNKTRQCKTSQDNTGQDNTIQCNTIQDKLLQYITTEDNTTIS